MCGSGTLVIEAAMMALDMPPGALREFGFQKFLDHDADEWQALRTEVMGRASKPRPLEQNVDHVALRHASKPSPLVSAVESVIMTQGSQMD